MAKESFSEQDRKFIQTVAGRHPYLIQVAADTILEVNSQGISGVKRYESASHLIYRSTKAHFEDTWRMWSSSKRKAIAAIALAEMPGLISERNFAVDELIDDLPNFAPEMDDLRDVGVVTEIEDEKYEIAQKALLLWLADEIIRQIRDDEASFDDWIKTRELDGLLTKGERQRLAKAAGFFVKMAQQGTSTVIEAIAKGFGESLCR